VGCQAEDLSSRAVLPVWNERMIDPPQRGCYWGLYSARNIYTEVPSVYGAGSGFLAWSRGARAPASAPVLLSRPAGTGRSDGRAVGRHLASARSLWPLSSAAHSLRRLGEPGHDGMSITLIDVALQWPGSTRWDSFVDFSTRRVPRILLLEGSPTSGAGQGNDEHNRG
jgi:hypothetical protein